MQKSEHALVPPLYDIHHCKSIEDIWVDLELSTWMPAEKIAELQSRRLKRVLEHAYATVPYYRGLLDGVHLKPGTINSLEDFQRIPILKKSDIQSHLPQLISQSFPKEQLFVSATGGSTGNPITYYRDMVSMAWVDEAAKRFRRWMGYIPEDKIAFIWGADRDIPKSFPPNERWLNSFNLSGARIEEFLKELLVFKPRIIRGYATALTLVAEYAKSRKLTVARPHCIESSAETLYDWQRALIQEVFQCPVFNMYGSREVPCLASECDQHNGLHLFSDLRLVEIIRDGHPAKVGEVGSIVVTDLCNYGMPFIRYEIGDLAILDSTPCACGRSFPKLKEVKGRVSNVITTPDRRFVHGEFFTHLFYQKPGIKTFQIRQRSLDQIQVVIVPDRGYDPAVVEGILDQIKHHLGASVHCQLSLETSIPSSPTGKQLFTMSDVPLSFEGGGVEIKATPPMAEATDMVAPTSAARSTRKRLLMVADVPNWIFEKHCHRLKAHLSDEFEISIKYANEPYDEAMYDLIYPLEWHMVDGAKIIDRAKYVTGIRSHLSWAHIPIGQFADYLSSKYAVVHVVSDRLYRQFKPVLPSVQYVTHGVDTVFYTPERPNERPSGKLRIGWAGNRSAAVKGFGPYIEPLGRIPGVELVFCGYSDENLTLEKMKEFYNSIDAYVCASETEGNNNSLLEAASMACAIITTDVGTVPEYLADGLSAFIVERSLPAFEKAVIILRDNPALRMEMGNKARQNLLEGGWDWSLKIEDFRNFFRRVANPNPGQKTAREARADASDAADLNECLALAQKAFEKGDLAAACQHMREAVAREPKNAKLVMCLGELLFQLKEYVLAGDAFTMVTALDPSHADAWLNMALVGLELKHIETFEIAIGAVLKINPDHEETLRLLGRLNLVNKRFLDAARYYSRLAAFKPRKLDDLLALGRCFFELQDLETALTVFEECLKEDAANATALENVQIVRARMAPSKKVSSLSLLMPTPEPGLQSQPEVPVSVELKTSPKPQSGSFSITYFVESMLGVTGGNQTLLRQANEMARRGHRVAIVTRTDRPSWFQFDPSITIFKAEPNETLAAKTPPCDVAVATYFTNVPELAGAPAATKVYYAQGDQYVFEEEGLLPGHGARLHSRFRELSRQSYILPDVRFVANSHNLAGAARRVTGRLADGILPVCVDQTMFHPLAKAPASQPRRILIVGPDFRGSAAEPLDFKGMAEIRTALELLQKKGHSFVTVRMSGSPPEIFKDFPCEFHMAPADSLKTLLYGTADILIYASHYDSCPRPPQEAMAAGVAVVCTATDGAREYCRDNENCLLVPIKSPVEIAGAVEKLLLDEDLRKRLVAGGLATAGEFPQEREWNEWEAMVSGFVQEQKGGVVFKAKFASPAGPSIKIAAIPASTTGEFPATGFVGRLKKAYELFGQSKFPEAWRSALEALKVRPFHPEAYVMMGETALAAGDAPLASKCAQRALNMAPKYDLALNLKKLLVGRKKGARSMQWPALPPYQPDKPRLSICLIAKNEEAFLGKCLASIKPIAHQIIVVDTGSTDRTVAIAREYGAEVYHFTWNDNFSDARNASLEHATGDWILVLDADEELPEKEHAELIKAMSNPAVIGYRLAITHVGFEGQGADHVPRLFRNAPGLHFAGRVHEQVFHTVVLKCETWGLKIDFCEALLVHHGYEANLMKSRQKVERNLQLLEQAVEEMPGEPNILLNLGLELSRSGRSAEGLARYQQAFEIMSGMPPASVVPELCEGLLTQYTSHLIKARRFNDAVQVLHSPLAARLGLTATMYYILGVCLGNLQRHEDAVVALKECLKKRNDRALTIILKEIKTESPYICLAASLMMLDRTDEAEAVYQKALQEFPNSRAARREYAGFQVHKKQPVEALKILHALVVEKADDAQAWEQGGKVVLSDPDFMEAAMDWTDSAIRNCPDHGPLVAQRAECLMLAQDAAGALPLWTANSLANNPRNQAGGLLCGIVTGDLTSAAGALHPSDEASVSREFLEHYRKLVRFGTERTIRTINEGIEEWKPLLPSAAQFLKRMMAEVRDSN